MPFELTPLHAEKCRIVHDLFIRTADDNYIAARWCFAEGLNVDFFWLAVHALEKYLKSILLLNNLSAKRYGHDIVRLFQTIHSLAPDLLPTKLHKPDLIKCYHWYDENIGDFVGRMYNNGNEHNRYLIFGFSQRGDDLFKLDQCVFACRRLCRPLDAYWAGRLHERAPSLTNREYLARKPRCWRVSDSLPLEKAYAEKRGTKVKDAFLRLNASFAPDRYEHEPMPFRSSAANPVLLRAIPSLGSNGPERGTDRQGELEICEWLLSNVVLPRDVECQISAARDRLRSAACSAA
jgi:HEPN domain-containing protein